MSRGEAISTAEHTNPRKIYGPALIRTLPPPDRLQRLTRALPLRKAKLAQDGARATARRITGVTLPIGARREAREREAATGKQTMVRLD
jgi:hypothetical protein